MNDDDIDDEALHNVSRFSGDELITDSDICARYYALNKAVHTLLRQYNLIPLSGSSNSGGVPSSISTVSGNSCSNTSGANANGECGGSTGVTGLVTLKSDHLNDIDRKLLNLIVALDNKNWLEEETNAVMDV